MLLVQVDRGLDDPLTRLRLPPRPLLQLVLRFIAQKCTANLDKRKACSYIHHTFLCNERRDHDRFRPRRLRAPTRLGSTSPSTAPTEPPAPRRSSSSWMPGAELSMHTDSAEELLIMRFRARPRRGRVGDEVDRWTTGQVGLVPPMAPHGLRNIGDDVLPRVWDVLRLDRGLDVRAPLRGKRTTGRRHRLARRVGRTPGGGGRVAVPTLLAERSRAREEVAHTTVPGAARMRRPIREGAVEITRNGVGDTTRAGRVVHRHRLRRRARDAVQALHGP